MKTKNFDRSSQLIIWFSRILRWTLGLFFIITGILYASSGGWPVILFGALIFITGFFKPQRCMQGNCNLP